MGRVCERLKMTVETFLIRLRDGATRKDTDRVVNYVQVHGGRVEALLKDRSVVVGVMERSLAENVRSLPSVALVGGVIFKGRKILKITKRKK
jgi:hypothetical protein